MYLKSIVIKGFKSFLNTTKLDLDNNITGVVGPNGSGKSNIVDAVRWVLGEQSIKSLRGSENMSDVIFSGTEKESPLNKSSVALVLDNSDRFFDLDYSEVEIKRRLYRDGTNEYYLNGEKVRLKDISELLIDTGLSKESFNIISQGKVEEILSNKPEERRIIFEEAAGVLKYKKRKEAAIRKLERTHDNLDRVNDIVAEIEPRIEPLKEESERASKYLDAKKELEGIELALITEDIERMNYEYGNNKVKLEKLEQEVIKSSSEYESNDSLTEKIRLDINKMSEELNLKQKDLVEAAKNVEKLKGEKLLATERGKYNAADSKVYSEIVNLKELVSKREGEIALLESDLKSLTTEKNNLLNKIDVHDKLINTKRENLNSFNEDFSLINKRKVDLEYKIEALNNAIENNTGLYRGVKEVLNNPRLSGIIDPIGKLIDVEEKYAVAIETALGAASQFIVCNNESNARDAIYYLKEGKLGKATFFPISVIKGRSVDDSVINLLRDDDSFIGVASDLVSTASKYVDIITNQLGNTFVVKDIDSAIQIGKKINNRYRIVTLDGELIHVGGSLTGGQSKNSSVGMIREKYELESLIRDKEKLEIDLKSLEIDLKKATEELNVLESKKHEFTSKFVEYNENIEIKNKTLGEKSEEFNNLKNELNSLKQVVDGKENPELNIIDEYYNSSKELEELTKEVDSIKEKKDSLSRELDEVEADIRKNNSEYNKKQNELKDLEVLQGKLEVKLDSQLNILSTEYGMTFEKAKEIYKLDIPESIARNKVRMLKSDIKTLGIVNIAAIEEFERVSKRYEFLSKQRDDLYKAEEMLLQIIKEMDVIMKDKFSKSFKLIEENFKKTFTKLFGGGVADLVLTDPDNVLETGIDITCQPPGKKLKHISLLSGGEKALTAISLLFAIISIRKVPFCVLDEVEAALDDVNVKKFGDYLIDLSKKTQFIVITHKKKTMEYADVLYGVTMQEEGISKLVSVKLEQIKKEGN